MSDSGAKVATTGPASPLGICLAGPTASGKTAAALALALRLPVEIISVDSALVYRGMDIGTAKPTAAERAAAPHHLIDILDPSESYSAARFAAEAAGMSQAIRGRGRVPLLVGGTMLYFKALRDGLHVLPQADASVRAAIDTEAAERGWPALHAELARVDPATAARLAPADAQRIQRALEVWRTSGRTLSDWHADTSGRQLPQGPDNAALWPVVSLEPTSRAWLHQRIAQRCESMFEAGLVAEVAALRERPDLHKDLPSMRCVGYRQIWSALDGGDMSEMRAQVLAATRQLAKRQLTWLRSITDRVVVDCDTSHVCEQVSETLFALSAKVAR